MFVQPYYASAADVFGGVAGASLIIVIISYALVLLVALLINIMISLMFKRIAVMKGHREIRYFWMPFFFGIVGYILVAGLPDRGIPAITQNNNNNT